VVALGAYGAFGDPSPAGAARVGATLAALPAAGGTRDVFLYAIDEACGSDRGPRWRRELDRAGLGDLAVGHTCAADPRGQAVDLVLTPAQSFDGPASAEARRGGRRVWVYNGALPRSGTMLLDAPLASLRASAWIAALYDVGRWFLWETTFWDDGNRGGRGPIDPYLTAESFHNADGDAALGDGLLLYPGAQRGRFAERSLGHEGVLPSMRLKSLRRGIQDAGYLALARRADPGAADAIARRLVPAALDEVAPDAATPWPATGDAFDRARRALFALIPAEETIGTAEAEVALAGGRRAAAPQRPDPRALIVALAVAVLGGALGFALRRRGSRVV
jgi:hypothetical protein